MTVRGYTRPLVEGDYMSGDVAALRALGVDEIVVESNHRRSDDRHRLAQELSAGDEVVVTSLERFAPRLDSVISGLAELQHRGVHVRCPELAGVELREDTAVAPYEVLMAYMEHPLAAKARQTSTRGEAGKRAGRRRVLDDQQIAKVLELRRAGRSIPSIARELGIAQTTAYRAATGQYLLPTRADTS